MGIIAPYYISIKLTDGVTIKEEYDEHEDTETKFVRLASELNDPIIKFIIFSNRMINVCSIQQMKTGTF